MSDARSTWVDYAKGLGILLVVYGHVARGLMSAGIHLPETFFHTVDSVAYTFHMPLFFFLSGLFFRHSIRRRGRGRFVLSKIDTVVYPYLLWSIIQGLIEVLMSRYTNGGASLKDVLSILWQPRAQFWFLYALFMVFVLAAVVYVRDAGLLAIMLWLVSIALYLGQDTLPLVFNLGFVWRNFTFIAFGVLFSMYMERGGVPLLEKAMLPLGVILVGAEYYFHEILNLTFKQYGAWTLALALLGVLFVSSLSMRLARAGLMKGMIALGQASMAIYLMHTIAASGVRVVLQKFAGMHDPWSHLALGFVLGVCLPWLAYELLRKFGAVGVFEAPPVLSFDRTGRTKQT